MRYSRIQMRPKGYDGPMPPLERRIRKWSDRIGRGEPYLLRGSSLPPSFPELVPSRSTSPVSSVPSLTDLELIEDQIPAPPDVLMATAGPSRPPAMMASNDPRKRPGMAPAQPAPPKDINEDPDWLIHKASLDAMPLRSGRCPTPCVSIGEDDEDPTIWGAEFAGISGADEMVQWDEPTGYVLNVTAHECASNSNQGWTLVASEVQELKNAKVPNKLLCTCTSGCIHCNTMRNHSSKNQWLLDSGASLHFTNSLNDFVSYRAFDGTATTATKAPLTIEGRGTVIIKHQLHLKGKKAQTKYLRIFPVLYAPRIVGRLLSLGQLLKQGMRVYGDAAKLTLVTSDKNIPMMQCTPFAKSETLYWLNGVADSAHHTNVVYSIDYSTVHNRLGHASKEVLRNAKKHVKGFPDIKFPWDNPLCSGCAQGKMPMKAFPSSESRTTKPFIRIHSDVKSFPIESYHKWKYFVSFVDDYSSFAWVTCMREKSYVITALRHFLAMVKNQYGTSIKEWMSDAGGEYKSNAFLTLLKDQGIKILQSAPHTPQQNGRAERFNRTLMDKAESMRHYACLPASHWEFAVYHALHIYNRTPVKRLQWRTAFEVVHNEKPDISHLRVFGCGAYVHIPADVRTNKLAPKSELMTYLGDATGQKSYLFIRSNGQLFSNPTALFDELLFPRCKTTKPRPLTAVDEPIEMQPPLEPSQEDDDAPAQPPAYPGSFDEMEYRPYIPWIPLPKPPKPSKPKKGKAPLVQHPLVPTRTPGRSLDSPPRAPMPLFRPTAPSPTRQRQPSAGPSRVARTPSPLTPVEEAPPIPVRSPERPRGRPLVQDSPPHLRRSERQSRAPTRPGNVYGEQRRPAEIARDISRSRTWQEAASAGPSRQPSPGPSGGLFWTPSSTHVPAPPLPRTPSPPPLTPLEFRQPASSSESSSGSGSYETNGSSGSHRSRGITTHGADSQEEVDNALLSVLKEGGVRLHSILLAQADAVSEETPREWTYKDIQRMPYPQRQEWEHACRQELDSLRARGVYTLVSPPTGRKIIRNRWVFDIKTDGRKKARLVAKGFSQIEGIDYDEIFSPVVRYETVRLIFALAAIQRWHMYSVDVKTAFLYGELDEELYMLQPEGFRVKGQEHKSCV
jgi:transposase InsO family protein